MREYRHIAELLSFQSINSLAGLIFDDVFKFSINRYRKKMHIIDVNGIDVKTFQIVYWSRVTI